MSLKYSCQKIERESNQAFRYDYGLTGNTWGAGGWGGCRNQQNLKCGKLQTDDPVSSKINSIKGKREREAVHITKCSAQTVFILI